MLGFFKKLFGMADANKDGKVDAKDAKVVAEKVEARVEAAAAKIQAQSTKVVANAKNTVKKTAAKTVKAKKAAPKSQG